MRRIEAALGFVVLSGVALYLYATAAARTAADIPLLGGVFLLGLLGLVAGISGGVPGLLREDIPVPPAPRHFGDFTAVVVGAILAFIASVELALGPVLGAAAVGLVAGVMLPQYGVPAFCGAFVGMASPELLCLRGGIIVAAVAAGVLYVISEGVYGGYGGKLGTIALAGCVLSAGIFRESFHAAEIPSLGITFVFVLGAAGAAVATFYLSIDLGYGPVLGSSAVGLLGGLTLPALHATMGATAAVVVFCASFVGMSSPRRLPTHRLVLIAGAVSGLAFAYSSPYFGGAGGKLGTLAFGAVISVNGLHALVKRRESSHGHAS